MLPATLPAALLAILLVMPAGARAEFVHIAPTPDGPVPVTVPEESAGEVLAEQVAARLPDDHARLAWIQARLAAHDRKAKAWWRGWTAGYASLAMAQGAGLLLLDDPDLQPTLIVGAIGSTLGTFGMLISPMRPVRHYAGRAGDLHADNPAALPLAEGLLDDAARRAREGRGVVNHLLGAAVALGGSAWLWLDRDMPVEAATNLVISLAVGQAQIWTQPTVWIDESAAYRAQAWQARGAAEPPAPRWSLLPQAGGVSLALAFR